MPLGSILAGTPPGVNTTSLTGLPLIATCLPPTWKEPVSRSAIGSAAFVMFEVSRMIAVEKMASRDMIPSRSIPGILRRFPSGDPSEHAADGHADAGGVALAEYVARHDLAGGEHVGGRLAVLHQHAGLPVHAGAEIGEGDARPHRIGVIGRRLDLAGPMRLRRRQPFGAAIVENGVVEGAGPHRGVEIGDGLFQ